MNTPTLPTITVHQLHQMQLDGTPHYLVDVREPCEHNKGNIGGHLIPLGQLPEHIETLKNIGKPIFLLCKSGGRSGRAAAYLLDAGLDDVYNVEGGALAWREAIDPGLSI
jgi:sulfur-carrier protein adenylyltransferase/sulfurtransferase